MGLAADSQQFSGGDLRVFQPCGANCADDG